MSCCGQFSCAVSYALRVSYSTGLEVGYSVLSCLRVFCFCAAEPYHLSGACVASSAGWQVSLLLQNHTTVGGFVLAIQMTYGPAPLGL